MSKQTPPPEPPTIITVTLNTDGTATLLAQRGDLAVLHAFMYRALEDIVNAMQQGATRLIDLDAHPPAKEFRAAETAMSSESQAAPVSMVAATDEDALPDGTESEPDATVTTPASATDTTTASDPDQLSLF